MVTPDELVRREVHYCVSSLVSTLAKSAFGVSIEGDGGDLADLTEQAAELAAPVPDYEEALTEAGSGWTFQPYPDDSPAKAHEPGYWWRPAVDIEANDEDENGEPIKSADNAQLACESDNIDPYDREVYEHWIVSNWLADKLAEKGEKVDKDFAGMVVWSRTTTGQAISIDWVIEQITADLNAPEAGQ